MISGQNISLIFIGIFLALTAIGLLKGISRGTKRQIVRSATIAISIIAALAVTTSISNFISSLCHDKTLDEVLMALGLHEYFSPELLEMFACYDAVTAERLIELPLMSIIMPFIFTICFSVVSSLMLIIHGIFCLILGFSKKSAGVGSRLFGMIIGAVQGAVVALIFLLPIMNLVGIAGDTNEQIINNHDGNTDEVQFCQIYEEYVEPTRNSPLFAISYELCADPVCDRFATIDIDGDQVNLRDTMSMLLISADDFMELGGFNWASPTEEQCAALEQIVEKLSNDAYVTSIMSGALRGTAVAIDSGIIPFQLEEPVLGVMNSLVSVFTTLNEDNFASDVDTILDIYVLLASENVLSTLSSGSSDDITTVFIQQDENGNTVIKRVISTIQSNEHMSPLVTMLTKLSLSIMMNNTGIENGEEIYETVKEGITDVLKIDKTEYATDEEYHEAVSDKLGETLLSHNIELSTDIVDNMATYIVDNYANVEEISDEEVNDIILSYYDSYMKYVEEGGENPFPGILPDGGEVVLPEGGEVVLPEGGVPFEPEKNPDAPEMTFPEDAKDFSDK